MIVTGKTFHGSLARIALSPHVGVDTETSGLLWWKDKLFCILVSTEEEKYYFNFNDNSPSDYCLPRYLIPDMQGGFNNKEATFFAANAKFDLHMLANEGLSIEGDVWCLTAQERVLKNNRLPNQYNLNALAKNYLNEEKEDIETYIRANKLVTKVKIPGKKREEELLHFDRVPFEVMRPYAEKDMDLHLKVGLAQKKLLAEYDTLFPANHAYGGVRDVSRNEVQLTKTCFKMERTGIKLRKKYTQEAMAFEQKLLEGAKEDFRKLVGLDYVDSRSCFVPAFDRLGIPYPRTDKGNPSFKADVLEEIDNPVARAITQVRHFEKRIGTYYSSFLYYADDNDVIHANINQGGTETGRMSYSNPNLQNVPKEDEEEDLAKPYLVRGCFAPREDHCFVMVDWKQQEYRMLLDYAGEKNAIEVVMDGQDPYIATATLCGITRKQAKVVVLALQYGMGISKLAKMLGVSEAEAHSIRKQFFSGLPKVQMLLRSVQTVAKTRKYIRNWFGRVCYLDDIDYAYVMVNRLIQGGSGDCAKVAMNQVSSLLEGTRSNLLVQVHDELVAEMHQNELDLVPKIAEIMDNVYKPKNGMRLQTSVEHSWVSWGTRDKVKGEPNERVQTATA